MTPAENHLAKRRAIAADIFVNRAAAADKESRGEDTSAEEAGFLLLRRELRDAWYEWTRDPDHDPTPRGRRG